MFPTVTLFPEIGLGLDSPRLRASAAGGVSLPWEADGSAKGPIIVREGRRVGPRKLVFPTVEGRRVRTLVFPTVTVFPEIGLGLDSPRLRASAAGGVSLPWDANGSGKGHIIVTLLGPKRHQ